MEVIKPEKFLAKLSDRYYVNDSRRFLLTKFELVSPRVIEFLAGQYLSLKVSEKGVRRSYSFATTPDVKHGFTLLSEIIPDGLGSKYLLDLPMGGEIEALAPLGKFVIGDEAKLLFVATGSGIVPIYSMITDLLLNKHEKRPIRLHWGMRRESDVFWFDNLERLAENNENFVFDLVLSQANEEWSLCSGHVQDCLSRDFEHEDMSFWGAYVCGNSKMVGEVKTLLREMGVSEENFHYEKFTEEEG